MDIIKDALKYALNSFEQLHNTQTYHGDNQDFSDEIITMRAALAELEQPPAVEPAQEQITPSLWEQYHGTQKQEPAQAVPVGVIDQSDDGYFVDFDWSSSAAGSVKIGAKVYTAPPAIDDDIEYQVWRSTDSCEEFWSWDECEKEDYDRYHPTARRIIKVISKNV